MLSLLDWLVQCSFLEFYKFTKFHYMPYSRTGSSISWGEYSVLFQILTWAHHSQPEAEWVNWRSTLQWVCLEIRTGVVTFYWPTICLLDQCYQRTLPILGDPIWTRNPAIRRPYHSLGLIPKLDAFRIRRPQAITTLAVNEPRSGSYPYLHHR